MSLWESALLSLSPNIITIIFNKASLPDLIYVLCLFECVLFISGKVICSKFCSPVNRKYFIYIMNFHLRNVLKGSHPFPKMRS
jgi:hypothetical protein